MPTPEGQITGTQIWKLPEPTPTPEEEVAADTAADMAVDEAKDNE